jgi:hypothetical protein
MAMVTVIWVTMAAAAITMDGAVDAGIITAGPDIVITAIGDIEHAKATSGWLFA